MIVWNPEPTEYGDFNGDLDALGANVTVERSGSAWAFFIWGSTGVLIGSSYHAYRSSDEAKRAAENWAKLG